MGRRDGLQEGHDPRADQGVRRADQGRLLAHRLRALRPVDVPHLWSQVEDGQRDRRKEDGGPTLAEVERDGSVLLPATAAAGVRQLQELRGPLACRFLGRQRRGYAWKGRDLREEGGGGRRRQEEVSIGRLAISFRFCARDL